MILDYHTLIKSIQEHPERFTAITLGPEPRCERCSHVELDHRLDKTCGKCVCHRFVKPEAEGNPS